MSSFTQSSIAVFYVPSTSCSNWNLRCSWNPTFHVTFLAGSYLSPTLIGTEDEVVHFWFLIDTSRSFFSLLLPDSQIWLSDYESIPPTISSCGSHLILLGALPKTFLKIFNMLAYCNYYQHGSQNNYWKLWYTQVIFLGSWLLSSLISTLKVSFSSIHHSCNSPYFWSK